MKRLQFFRVAALGLILAGIISGCGKKEESPSGATGTTPQQSKGGPLPEPPLIAKCEPGIPGGRAVLATISDPKTFNPITANETSSIDIVARMFIGLLSIDVPTQQVQPGLADTWEVGADNKTYTFHLRKGLRWSDGKPLNADDVIFTWNDVIYNTNIINVTVDLFRIDGKDFSVTKVDDYTVKIVTPEIYAPFLYFFGSVAVLPKHALESAVKNKQFESAYGINSNPADVVCNGPFRLKQYKPGQFVLMERNPEFCEVDKKGQRLPYFENVIYTIVPDMSAMSLRFLRGEADIQEDVRPEEYEKFKEEATKGRFELLDLGLSSQQDCLTFNQNTNLNASGKPIVDPVKLKWFRNTKFRQAISFAIDREAIVRSALGGHGAPRYGFVSEAATMWYNPNIKKYPYSPEKARALLAEIGIKDRGDGTLADSDGHPIAFVMNTNAGNDRRQKSAVIIQEDLKRLGIQLIFQPLDFNLLIDKYTVTFDYDCILMGWAGGPPDPVYEMNVLKSSGFSHEWFPRQKSPSTPWEARIDYLMNAQLKTLDQAERRKYFDEVQLILSEEMPMIPTVSMQAYSALRSDIANVRATTLDHNRLTWNLEELYYKKK